MHILVLESHPMWISGLPNGFLDLGHEVMVSGPLTKENIHKLILEFKPDLILTMGWTSEHSTEKVDWIRKYVKTTKVPHIYWATEDPTHTERFTLPLIQRMQPDFVFTICPQRVEFYRSLGIQANHMDFGYHSSVHKYEKSTPEYLYDIAVVANGYLNNLTLYPNHYRIQSLKTLITPLLKKNIRIDFWGWGWEEMGPILEQEVPTEWLHGYLHYNDANKIYSSSKIVLGLQNHPTQLTQRTYEILGSKGFLLTSDTPAIRALFEPGRDLAVVDFPEEVPDMVIHYLIEKEQRETIREQGHRAVAAHSYTNRAKYMLEVLYRNGIIQGY